MFAGLTLTAYGLTGLFNASVPGVEQLVVFLAGVEGTYIYLAAFVSILIEGLYIVGNFFPGSTLVLILAILSQLVGIPVFIATILVIFLGWCLAGVINILFARMYRSKIARLQEDSRYQIKDHLWTTWFPAFRANHEVAQVIGGANPFKVFLSSVRVKFFASVAAAAVTLVIPFFVDIHQVSNKEGFATIAIVAVVCFIVGGMKLRKYFR